MKLTALFARGYRSPSGCSGAHFIRLVAPAMIWRPRRGSSGSSGLADLRTVKSEDIRKRMGGRGERAQSALVGLARAVVQKNSLARCTTQSLEATASREDPPASYCPPVVLHAQVRRARPRWRLCRAAGVGAASGRRREDEHDATGVTRQRQRPRRGKPLIIMSRKKFSAQEV